MEIAQIAFALGLAWVAIKIITILAPCLFFASASACSGYAALMLGNLEMPVISGLGVSLASIMAVIMLGLAFYVANKALAHGIEALRRLMAPFSAISASSADARA